MSPDDVDAEIARLRKFVENLQAAINGIQHMLDELRRQIAAMKIELDEGRC
jgi:hypothetical protein